MISHNVGSPTRRMSQFHSLKTQNYELDVSPMNQSYRPSFRRFYVDYSNFMLAAKRVQKSSKQDLKIGDFWVKPQIYQFSNTKNKVRKFIDPKKLQQGQGQSPAQTPVEAVESPVMTKQQQENLSALLDANININ